MDNSIAGETVTLFTEDDELHPGVKVMRKKLIRASAYYRGLTSSGMRDAGLMKLNVPDVSNIGLQTVADFVEADDKQIVLPTSLETLQEVDFNHLIIVGHDRLATTIQIQIQIGRTTTWCVCAGVYRIEFASTHIRGVARILFFFLGGGINFRDLVSMAVISDD